MNSIKAPSSELIALSHFTIDRVADAVIWVDAHARIKRVNEAACLRLGYTKEELCNMTIPDINPDFHQENWEEHWRQNKKDKTQTFETVHKTKEGKIIPVEVTTNFITFEGEEYDCSFSKDISQRKKLLLEFKRFRNIMDQAGESIYIADPETKKFLDCNAEACSMLGYTKKEVLQLRIPDIVTSFHTSSPEAWDDFLKHLKETRKVTRARGVHQRKNGSRFPVEVNIAMRSYDGQEYILAVARDITLRIESEQKLEEAFTEIRYLKNRLEEENIYLQSEIKLAHNFDEIISKSEIFSNVLNQVQQVATTDTTVLILGESGTGKELLARAIHNISDRGQRPLVKVNCAALPANLIESELFGHEKGAFTGALKQKKGRFELADGGTIFLDEIGDLSPDLQAKLLRVLQEGEFERLGSSRTITANVRVIAATNKNLEKAIEKGKFREDLYYRLNVFPIHSPPLRERKGDIPILVEHFISKYNKKFGKNVERVSKKILNSLEAYNWPGNVRELENLIERALIISMGKNLVLGDWVPKNKINFTGTHVSLAQLEKEHILKVLNTTKGRIRGPNGAARILEINPNTLESRMKRLGIYRNL